MVHKKKQLDSKICEICKKEFFWRKKWKRDWVNVKYCSKNCSTKSI
ncbi:MAG: hypothetical protein CMM89_00025 [Rickettsiales bacterium]|jgi:hypothetical protein|nr:hypothetical protein [Rickettsiales bacterium]OUT47028.1 MAG: hypothetical protein CBB73_00025 [Pelagibacteraceae bacterium TMED13]